MTREKRQNMDGWGELTVYRGCAVAADTESDPESGTSATEAVVVALADAIGVDPIDVPPLYDYIDPDALNAMFDRRTKLTEDNAVLAFQVGTWDVFVRSDGRVRVCDATHRTGPERVFESPAA